jgi:hypothetical protein
MHPKACHLISKSHNSPQKAWNPARKSHTHEAWSRARVRQEKEAVHSLVNTKRPNKNEFLYATLATAHTRAWNFIQDISHDICASKKQTISHGHLITAKKNDIPSSHACLYIPSSPPTWTPDRTLELLEHEFTSRPASRSQKYVSTY